MNHELDSTDADGGVALGSRRLFPRLEARAYLAHASFAPASVRVERAVHELLDAVARRGLGALAPLLEAADLARARFAALISAEPADVAIVPNTSTGAVAIATALPWRAGERLVLFADDFPANVTPWQAAAARHGVEVVRLEVAAFARSTGEGLAALDAVLDRGGVRLVTVSSVAFQSGLALPVPAIARRVREHGAELFVDAIQSVGARPFDVRASGAHYVAAGAYKWLMGQLGMGFLWIDPAAGARLAPQFVGWLSHVRPDAFLVGPASELDPDRPLVPGARVFEGGTQNHLGLAAAAAAMGPLVELGPAHVHAHLQRYHDALEPELAELGFRSLRAREPDARSGILAAVPPAGIDAPRLVEALGARGIVANGPCGNLRFSPHWPNALDEVPAVVDALRNALDALR